MRRYVFLLMLFSSAAVAQQQQQQPQPTPDEAAFARLPADLQAQLADLPPRVALQKLDFARQNLIATGNPGYSHDQLKESVEAVRNPRYAAVRSASAGTMSFPPLSPLVPSSAFDYR